MHEITADNKNKKKALGRGLGTLLGGPIAEARTEPPKIQQATNEVPPAIRAKQDSFETKGSAEISTESKVWTVSIEKIKPGKFQPRKTFEKQALEELAQSIKQNGLLQPIIVRKDESGHFEIVAGERRWRAAQAAGLTEVPVLIKNFDNKKTLQLALIENIQRENLSPIEEGEAYSRLVTEFGMTQSDVAEKVGKDRTTITNLIRVLSLPHSVRELIKSKDLSLGHAKVLLSVTSLESSASLAKACVEQKWSVRRLEKEIQKWTEGLNAAPTRDDLDGALADRVVKNLTEELQKLLGTKTSIDYNQGRGKLSFSFYSDEELSSLVDKIKQGARSN